MQILQNLSPLTKNVIISRAFLKGFLNDLSFKLAVLSNSDILGRIKC